MSAWWNLLQKEFRMTRNSAFVSLAILLIGGFGWSTCPTGTIWE